MSAEILVLPMRSGPDQIRAIIATFTRELDQLRADPAAPDAARRERLYLDAIARYRARLAQEER